MKHRILSLEEKQQLVAQIAAANESGTTVEQACKDAGISVQTYYAFRRGNKRSNRSVSASKRRGVSGVSAGLSVTFDSNTLHVLYTQAQKKDFNSWQSLVKQVA